MQYLGRVAGIAALALGTIALSGCYAPPPVAEVTPDQAVAPYPARAYPLVAEATPGYTSPGYKGRRARRRRAIRRGAIRRSPRRRRPR